MLYSSSSNFYVADYRDTFFQADPFARLVERRGPLRGLELLLVAEHWPFKQLGNCPFNGGWVRNCWGRARFEPLRNQSVLCSGSYMGAQPAIVNLESTILAEARSRRGYSIETSRGDAAAATWKFRSRPARASQVDENDCHHRNVPSDQGYVNYLFYSGRLPAETFVETRGDGVVNTVGSLDGSRPRKAGYLPESHVNLGEYWNMRDGEGYVLEDDGSTRSAAVHQWDRFGLELHDFVAGLRCDPGTCYQHPAAAR